MDFSWNNRGQQNSSLDSRSILGFLNLEDSLENQQHAQILSQVLQNEQTDKPILDLQPITQYLNKKDIQNWDKIDMQLALLQMMNTIENQYKIMTQELNQLEKLVECKTGSTQQTVTKKRKLIAKNFNNRSTQNLKQKNNSHK